MIRRSGTQSATPIGSSPEQLGSNLNPLMTRSWLGCRREGRSPRGKCECACDTLPFTTFAVASTHGPRGRHFDLCKRRQLPISDHIVGEVGQRVLQSDSATFAPYERDAESAPGAFWVLYKIGCGKFGGGPLLVLGAG